MSARFDPLPPEAGAFMQVWADKLIRALDNALDDIIAAQADIVAVNEEQQEAIVAIQAAQAAADAANAAALAADAAAAAAQDAADDANAAIVVVNTTIADHETRIQALEP